MKYRVLQPCIISINANLSSIRALPGEIIEFDGMPGPHLEPLDGEAIARVATMSAAERAAAGYKGD